ncbi:MAG: TetR family transcriptional regulator [Desulfobacteraceae bacterium 4572_123]|nr:MAG: TetR family transcriptional regulator [Desulfobacteraceae bacterium 4572_123]
MIVAKLKTNDKYHRILDAAIKVFAEQGFFQSTIAQVAREAGVADGTIYLYFKNKDDILFNFFNYKTRQVFSGFREQVSKGDNATSKLRNLIRRHLQEFQRDRNMAIVYQAETHGNSRVAEKKIKEMAKMYYDLVSEIVEQGQEEGVIRRDLYVGMVKRFILGAVDEVINTWLHSEADYDLLSMTDPLVDLFIRGIGNNDIPAQ